MTEPKKPKQSVWPLPATQTKPVDDKKSDSAAAGRVEHDARGNAVWNWSSTESTTHLLRKLDSPELSLADTGAVEKPAVPGVNPYEQRSETAAKGSAQAKAPKDTAPK